MQRKLIGTSVFVLVFTASLVSQGPENNVSIHGVVTNQTSAVIANASVTLRSTDKGTVWSSKTSASGNYTFSSLPAGTFDLLAEMRGFKTYRREKISLSGGQNLRIDVVLEVGSAAESVTVTSSSSLLKTESGEISTMVINGVPARQFSTPQMEPLAIGTSNYATQFGTAAGALYNQQPGLYDRYGRYYPAAPGTESYGHYVENEFTTPDKDPLSTFATDVDTASYANVRRFLHNGQLPPADSVRIEELINYFRYEYPVPRKGEPVSLTTTLLRSPWNPQHQLLQVGLRTTPVAAEELPPSHLTFLIDVSGSMGSPDKLPLVQQALQMLTRQLRPQDTVALAVYAGAAGAVLPPTPGSRQREILDAVGRLQAGGSTAGAEGIRLAYQMARQSFDKKANNRVILATDGDFNVGVTSDDELVKLIERERESGVFLSVLGFGTGNLQDSKMEKLADHGNGNYAYIDSLSEARKVFVQEMGATLVTVAKDVKLQIEFNPARVKSYRLIGYENRLLRPEDFNNDAKDAGDLGAGHQVTAFYEIVPVNGGGGTSEVDALRYQNPQRQTTRAGRSDELAWVKLRHKSPQADRSELLEWPVQARVVNFESAPRDVRFATAVVEYGLLLRHSRFAEGASFEHAMSTAADALGPDLEGHRAEFVDLVRKAANLSGAAFSRR